MAHKKGGGSSKNGRDSNPKFLGVKKGMFENVKSGEILLKQKGLKVKAGCNVGVASDFSLFSLTEGLLFLRKDNDNLVLCILSYL